VFGHRLRHTYLRGIDGAGGCAIADNAERRRQLARLAADPSGTWIYAPGVDGKVHKLDASTGAEIRAG